MPKHAIGSVVVQSDHDINERESISPLLADTQASKEHPPPSILLPVPIRPAMVSAAAAGLRRCEPPAEADLALLSYSAPRAGERDEPALALSPPRPSPPLAVLPL